MFYTYATLYTNPYQHIIIRGPNTHPIRYADPVTDLFHTHVHTNPIKYVHVYFDTNTIYKSYSYTN